MSHFKQVYQTGAVNYERLVSREDYQGNLLKALQKIRDMGGLDVVEFGAGTGRVTMLLVPLVKYITATDISEHMLAITVEKLEASEFGNWKTQVGDSRAIGLPDACADLSIAGWCYGHATEWHAANWREEIGRSVAEMLRVLRPGGTAIIMETMGTGSETPTPPSQVLAEYYDWLENEHGFQSKTIRTDYKFASLAEAEELTRFFFGDEMGDVVVENNWVTLPECTGIWWKTV